MASLASLPDDLLCHLVSFLPAPDVLSFVSVNRDFHCIFGRSLCLWSMLYARDGGGKIEMVKNSQISSCGGDKISDEASSMKKAYLTHSYLTCLPWVRWCQPKRFARTNTPSAREGHGMCVMGTPPNRMIVMTGGFTGDNDVHILRLSNRGIDQDEGKWVSVRPSRGPPSFVYGASLTAIDDFRAVRFGGFRGGGYSSETSQVCLLTLRQGQQAGGVEKMDPSWEAISVRGRPPPGRAYHTATFMLDRYLIIIGGMKAAGCMLQEAVLDVETWTWLPTRVSSPQAEPKPSARHGHSVVMDEERNRLVLFGGASGSDLLRSGRDNSEVWELKMGENWKQDFESSFPWMWSKVHHDADETENEYGETALLSRKERLCLGRCHFSGKVATNTVLLAFGSGRPSTNGMIAYNLRKDTFHRPPVSGRLPIPRFTAAGVIVNGWLVVHGGYSVTNHYGTLGDVVVLDLAPGLKRWFAALPMATPFLQQAITVLKNIDHDIKSPVEGQPLSLLRRCLLSFLKAWSRLFRKVRLLRREQGGQTGESN